MKTNALFLTLILLLLLNSIPVSGQAGLAGKLATLPAHPRLLLLQGEEISMRKAIEADPIRNKVHRAIVEECDKLIDKAPVERIQIGRRLLDKSRECLRRVFYLSYAYRVSGQEKYLKRAEKELLAGADFSDWNPSHFLDVAEMTMAVAIGYDWLHTALPEASKVKIRAAILKKGIEPSMDAKYNSWLKASHNWNQVCNAGMTYGAIAIYEDHPELARQIITRSMETITLPMEDYNPDGAYPEGYGYWGYGTSFHVMFNSAIEKLLGKDSGLPQNAGFLKTASYLLHMTGPSGDCFNYSDSGLKGDLQPAMFWFAQKLGDPSLLWVERGRLTEEEATAHTRDRLLPAMLIWSQGINMAAITQPKAKSWVGAGKNPVALMRTSWTDPNAIYVGFKGGSPSVNHGHMDVGSFIMEASGVRWAMDFGVQSYESLESKGVKLWGKEQDSQRWEIFRYHNLSHNTLTVNNGLQRVEGYAPITRHADNPAFTYATTDLSAVYKGQLTKANRGVAIADGQYVVVRDEVETSAECTIRWTMVTAADVKITSANQVELTKDGKKLRLKVQHPAQVVMKTWPTDPPHAYDAPNPGTTLVGFEVKMPQNSKGEITVLLIPEGAESKAASRKIAPLANWPK